MTNIDVRSVQRFLVREKMKRTLNANSINQMKLFLQKRRVLRKSLDLRMLKFCWHQEIIMFTTLSMVVVGGSMDQKER
jgi:hypothetical protein